MTAKSKAEMMRRLRDERRKAGLVKVEVWVPAKLAYEVRDLAKDLRNRTG